MSDTETPLVSTTPEGRKTDRRINVTSLIAVITPVLILMGLAMVYPTWRDSTRAAEGVEMATCRAFHRASVDRALTHLLTISSDLEVTTSEALDAVVRGDDDELARHLELARPVRSSITEAAVEVRNATADYDLMMLLATEDPQAFLATCQ